MTKKYPFSKNIVYDNVPTIINCYSIFRKLHNHNNAISSSTNPLHHKHNQCTSMETFLIDTQYIFNNIKYQQSSKYNHLLLHRKFKNITTKIYNQKETSKLVQAPFIKNQRENQIIVWTIVSGNKPSPCSSPKSKLMVKSKSIYRICLNEIPKINTKSKHIKTYSIYTIYIQQQHLLWGI